MALIPEDTIAEIRERGDIVAVIGQHVELKKAGRNFKGLCPFHNEKSPSFNVNGDKGFFYCFGCQKKGDIFTFVMEYEGRSFVEAAETLANRFGILIPDTGESKEQSAQRRSDKSQMLDMNKLATEFFRGQLDTPRGEVGRQYLQQRGIGAEQSERFQLGFAPDEWGALCDFLHARGANLRVAEKIGLVKSRNSGKGYYDAFRNRLMCPIMQNNGEVVGFSGRTLSEDEDPAKGNAKYINSPESPIYKKSKLLFGIYQAREAFRKRGHAILVEGNFDVIRLHEHGFEQTVAPLGTAFTDDQALRLRRLTESVVLLYDGDNAGRAATIKGLQVLLRQEVSVRIASLPAGDDPDSLIEREGPEALRDVLSRAQPAVEYFIHEVWVRADRSAEGRARTLGEAAQVLKSIKDETQRDFAVGTFATALGVDEGTLRRGLRRALQSQRSARNNRQNTDLPPQAAPRASNQPPPPRLQLDIITLIAEYPELLAAAEERGVFSSLTDTRLRDMYSAARAGQPMLSVTSDSTIAKALLSGAYASVENPTNSLHDAIDRLRSAEQRTKLSELQARAEEAHRRGDQELERQLFKEILATRKKVD